MRCAIYGRISTNDERQNLEVQLTPLREFVAKRGWQIVHESIDQESGLKEDRVGFNSVMELARKRKVDAIVVASLDRWGRSLKQLINSLDELVSLGVSFVSLRESLDFSTPTGQLMTHLLAAFSQFEVQLIRQRVKAGLANARNKGVKLGRHPVDIDVEKIMELRNQGFSIRKIAEGVKASPTTVFKTLKKMRQESLDNPVLGNP